MALAGGDGEVLDVLHGMDPAVHDRQVHFVVLLVEPAGGNQIVPVEGFGHLGQASGAAPRGGAGPRSPDTRVPVRRPVPHAPRRECGEILASGRNGPIPTTTKCPARERSG